MKTCGLIGRERWWLPLAAALPLFLPPPAAASPVQGVVTTKAALPRPIRVTIDQKVCGADLPDESIVVGPGGGLANVVVTVRGVAGKAAAVDPVVVNDRCRFTPRVQLVPPKAGIRTTSRDPMLHTTTVQTTTGQGVFNVALPQPGINVTRPIGGPGLYRVVCSIHLWMRAWIVASTDVGAVTDAAGRFTITDLPPGRYELDIWHETLKAPPQALTVVAGKPATVTIEMR